VIRGVDDFTGLVALLGSPPRGRAGRRPAGRWAWNCLLTTSGSPGGVYPVVLRECGPHFERFGSGFAATLNGAVVCAV
jgi:hypothetical protein